MYCKITGLKGKKKVLAEGLAAALLCLSLFLIFNTEVFAEEAAYKIGVAVYDTEDSEVQMFREYFEDYITDSC